MAGSANIRGRSTSANGKLNSGKRAVIMGSTGPTVRKNVINPTHDDIKGSQTNYKGPEQVLGTLDIPAGTGRGRPVLIPPERGGPQ